MSQKACIWSDGASRGNPGPAAIGAVIKDEKGKVHARLSQRIGIATNNQAEYQALLAALEKAIKLGAKQIDVYADSELLVRQLTGDYRVKRDTLKPLYARIKALQSSLESFRIHCVPREQNTEADSLANQALDAVD